MTGPIPDPLRRFVATPHIATLSHPRGELRIESNDAVFADKLAAYFRNASPSALLCAFERIRLVVEYALLQDGEDLTRLDAAHLRTVLRGTNTILVHDSDSHELLAFLAQGVSCEELIQRLLPAVAITNG